MSELYIDSESLEVENSTQESLTEEEIKALEECSKEYDEYLRKEEEQNPPSIGYCGFQCNFGCPRCSNSGYDASDE